jgi:hypothetical protein
MNLKKFIINISIITLGLLIHLKVEPIEMDKKAYVFDLDDTLIKTDAKIYMFTPDNVIYKSFTSEELKNCKNYVKMKIEEGYIMNFDEIGDDPYKTYYHLMNGMELIDNVNLMKKLYKKNPLDIYILTGRGNHPKIIQDVLNERFNIHLPISNIIPVAHKDTFEKIEEKVRKYYKEHPIIKDIGGKDEVVSASHMKKKLCIFSILMNGYDELHFYDDDHDNIYESEVLSKILKNYDEWKKMKIYNYLIK